jgi:Bacterial Ig-like domain (group 1)
MRKLSMMLLAAVVLVAGCGGSSKSITGEGSSSSSGGGSTTSTVTAISVVSSVAQIAADGSNSATISAVAKDANNNLVSGVTIAFAASAGGLAITQATTDTNGLATATLTAGTAASGTTITVTAASGTVSGQTTVAVGNAQQTITVITSLPQIPSDGSKPATITALVRDANNNFVSGAAVQFVSSSGGLTVTRGTTDASGSAIATLDNAGDPTNRVITVTASAGSSSSSVPVSVTGTSLTVTGSPVLSSGSQGTYTVTLTDSNGIGIQNKVVTLASALGNTLSAASVTTDVTGKQTFTVTATKAGSDTITATTLGITAGQSVAVSSQNFQFTTPASTGTATSVNLTSTAAPVNQTLTVTWTNNGAAQSNQVVNFATTRGTLSSATATTNSLGQASVTISSTVSGPATVTAAVTGVSAEASINFVATVPAVIDLQASPATIATLAQSTLTAVVRDANNNLVQGQAVTFQTVGDTTGGSLSVASAVTDAQGRAQTVYTASATPSATNGVTVQATVQGTAIAQTAKLTVGGQTVFLSLGTGSVINENSIKTQFLVPYTVEALDAGGNPVANVPITLTVHPLTYYKGGYYKTATAWVQSNTPASPPGTSPTACPNEDVNFNGVLDPGEDGCATGVTVPAPYSCNAFGNLNSKLDPGGTAVASPGTLTTAADGSASFNVIYPEDQALWVAVQLIATATVQGTETTASTTFTLPILATYISNVSSDPPGKTSPFGSATSCTNPN